MNDSFGDHILNDSDSLLQSESAPPQEYANQIRELQDKIDDLERENSSLKAQFEAMVSLSEQYQSDCSQISELKSQNRVLTSEIEELNHRLELSIQARDELVQQIKDEKRNNANARSETVCSNRLELDKLRQAYQQQIDELAQQLQSSTEINEKNEVTMKLYLGKVDRLVLIANRYFNKDFASIEDLTTFLSNSSAPQIHQEAPSSIHMPNFLLSDDTAEKLQHASARISKLKATNKELNLNVHNLEDEITRLKQEAKEASIGFKAQMSDIQNQCDATIADMKAKNLGEKQKLMQQIEQLKNELKETKKNIIVPGISFPSFVSPQQTEQSQASHNEHNPHTNPSQQSHVVYNTVADNERFDEERKALEDERDRLEAALSEAQSKVNAFQKRFDELQNTISDKDAYIDQLNSDIEKHRYEINATGAILEENKREIETLRKILHDRQNPNQQQKQPKKKDNYVSKTEHQQLVNQCDAQRKEIIDLTRRYNEIQCENDCKTRQIRDLQISLQGAEEKAKTAIFDLQDAQRKLDKKPSIRENDILPPETWRTSMFDSEVNKRIDELASNTSLQPVSKLQNIYQVLKRHYECVKECKDKSITDTEKEVEMYRSALSGFIVDVSVALVDSPFTIQDFFNKKAGETIVQTISRLRSRLDSSIAECESVKSSFSQFCSAFNIPFDGKASDVVTIASTLRARIEKQNQELSESRKKVHLLKESYREAASKSQARELDLINQATELKYLNDDLTKKNTTLSSEIDTLKQENKMVTMKLDEVSEEFNQLQNSFDEKVNVSVEDIRKQATVMANEVRAQVAHVEAEAARFVAEKADYEKKFKDLQTKATLLKSEKSQVESQFTDYKTESEMNMETIVKRHLDEKNRIENAFNETINNLKSQLESNRLDIQKLSSNVNQSNTQISSLKSSIRKLQSDKRRLESDAKIAKEQMEREKLILESQMRKRIIDVESQFNNRLDQVRSQYEAEQRRIYTYAAEQFKKFFNPTQQFNERAFKQTLESVKDELSRLTQSDNAIRRILGASDCQTTEDAVASLVVRD